MSSIPRNHADLGQIMITEVGIAACEEAYGSTDPAMIGRLALGYGDVNQDGTLN